MSTAEMIADEAKELTEQQLREILAMAKGMDAANRIQKEEQGA